MGAAEPPETAAPFARQSSSSDELDELLELEFDEESLDELDELLELEFDELLELELDELSESLPRPRPPPSSSSSEPPQPPEFDEPFDELFEELLEELFEELFEDRFDDRFDELLDELFDALSDDRPARRPPRSSSSPLIRSTTDRKSRAMLPSALSSDMAEAPPGETAPISAAAEKAMIGLQAFMVVVSRSWTAPFQGPAQEERPACAPIPGAPRFFPARLPTQAAPATTWLSPGPRSRAP